MKNKSPPDEPDPKAFQRFKNMAKRLVSVPKKEVDAAVRKAIKARKKRR
jgi:hypothetical protein